MTDKEAVMAAVLDYVEGWYSGDAKRMDRALSTHLAKRRITPDGEIMAVSRDWMVENTGKGIGQIDDPDSGKKEVTILSLSDTMASVELRSNDFIDFLHLVKLDAGWKIANALWDYY